MNKFKMLVLTALAAATVGTGALAAAPSASAMPISSDYCKSVLARWHAYRDLAIIFYSYGDNYWGRYFTMVANQYQDLYKADC